MPPNITFTLTAALQLSALLPCVFLAIYLAFYMQNKKLAIVPVLYFISLAAGIIYKLMPVFVATHYPHVEMLLLFVDSLMPALSFLLILQMMLGTTLPTIFWGILAVPAFAATPFIYAVVTYPDICTADIDICFSSAYALHLNTAVISSFIFMLLTIIVARRSVEMEGDVVVRGRKYGLILCLIIYNIILIIMEIGVVAELIKQPAYEFAGILVKIAFIYMVITSIFRVFNNLFDIKTPAIILAHSPLTEYEKSVASRAEKILQDEKIYRAMGFNRASFAKRLGVREHVLSRIINMYFNKSFSELANEYRLREAKELLAGTDMSITTISYDVGFSSITSFNRVFKEMTGKSPSAFREEAHITLPAGKVHDA